MAFMKNIKMQAFPIWQITLPFCLVTIFGAGIIAASHINEGRYIFDVDISFQGIKIRTDVDKRKSNLAGNEAK
jgi:hypothetical protein